MVMNNRKLSSPIMPVICTASLSFFVASVFLNVYEIAIDTILISFCVDKKMNDGSEKKKYYMSNIYFALFVCQIYIINCASTRFYFDVTDSFCHFAHTSITE